MTDLQASWYEVWADETQDVPYLLLLRPSSSGFEVIDRTTKVFESSTYGEAQTWLLEDEYVLVGRKLTDE
jgi:hypothetical protein